MIVFGSWDFLLRKAVYIILFVRIIGVPVLLLLLLTVSKLKPKISPMSPSGSFGSFTGTMKGSFTGTSKLRIDLDKVSEAVALVETPVPA
jgi:hypothetical protein